ncbi:MAG: cation-translocating P-type ATPase [Parachlamydiaceae bacterium]|nr:cation-translocating P-type ATPase [Parachlamydiaceae bacterium]
MDLPSHPIIDRENAFCCGGCHAVFNILTTKNQLDQFQDHPIFLQALKSGLISNPALIEQIQRQRAEIVDGERERLYIEVAEMWCPSCAEIIRLMLLRERGVINCVVDYTTDLASIEFSPRHLSKDQIFEIIGRLGYFPIPLNSVDRKAVSFDLYLRFIIAAFCSLNIMMLAYPLYATYFHYDGEGYGNLFAWLSLFVALPVVSYCAWPIWRRFLASIKVGLFGMETLIAIGVFSSFALSFYELLAGGSRVYFDSMSIIITFVLLGKIIEARAKFSAKESLIRLSRSTPRKGRKRFSDGTTQFVLVKDIHPGDILVAFTGEKISMDGIVTEGRGACDESLMTGEAMPVVKKEKDSVLAGAVLIQGHIAYEVTVSAEDSALAQIVKMVERDIGHKSVYVRAADKIVRWFVPLVIAIALLTAIICIFWNIQSFGKSTHETALLRAIAILLISCPCAIGIAAPTAESHLLNGLAALGAIVRNRGCLFQLGTESVIVFDKTGTATEGRFSVLSGIESLNRADRHVLYSLASQSTHPIAMAVAVATFSDEKALVFERIEEVAGQGIRGTIEGIIYYLGSAKFLLSNNIQPELHEKEFVNKINIDAILSTTYFGRDIAFLCEIMLGDKVRPELKEVILSLKPAKTVLLSGDAEMPVSMVAKSCGFDEWHSGCSPLEKRDYIDALRQKGHVICMIGDGINDAPALTAANTGISVVSATDMSIQVSDILLTTDRLGVITKIRALAKKGQNIVRQNLFWAFIYNIVGIFLAAFGVLSPIFAAFAMSISSLTVLFNARRL